MKIIAYKDSKGKTRYKFNIYLGIDELTGKEIRTNRSGFKSEKDAAIAYARLKNEGVNVSVNPTFEQVAFERLDKYKDGVKYSSYMRTESLFRTHILPHLGRKKIKRITPRIMQKLIDKKSKEIKSYTRINAYSSKVFELALNQNIISENPCDKVIYPKKKSDNKIEDPTLSVREKDELLEFLTCCKNSLHFMWYVYFRILSLTGMRKGEAQALEWNDINFKENKIRINKTISTYGRNKKHISNPKTSSSNRIISVDKTSIDLLKDRKKEQKEWNKNIRVEDKTQKYIFTTKDNELTYHNAPRKQFLKVVKNNNLRKIRLHDLRHTHASLCFEAGMSPKDVQYRLGHKEIQTTLDVYTKVTRGKEKASIEKFTDFMEI